MKKEFNLSEKILDKNIEGYSSDLLFVPDVKEFIKRLKECLRGNQVSCWFVKETIDKLLGDELI